jgi:hypothetical protein
VRLNETISKISGVSDVVGIRRSWCFCESFWGCDRDSFCLRLWLRDNRGGFRDSLVDLLSCFFGLVIVMVMMAIKLSRLVVRRQWRIFRQNGEIRFISSRFKDLVMSGLNSSRYMVDLGMSGLNGSRFMAVFMFNSSRFMANLVMAVMR